MKRILLSFIAIAIATLSSFGQSPEGFKYQAVIRDAGNLILTNQAVGMQLTIQQGSIGGHSGLHRNVLANVQRIWISKSRDRDRNEHRRFYPH